MIETMDAIIGELQTLVDSAPFQDNLPMDTEVKFGDPGVVMIQEYPYIYVQPISDTPRSETLGRAGSDTRTLEIEIGVVIDQSEYFDPDTNAVSGLRELLEASSLIRGELRRLQKRSLGGQVRTVIVSSTQYEPQLRGDAYVAVAKTSVGVVKSYPHTD
jgi:hypothetical protein